MVIDPKRSSPKLIKYLKQKPDEEIFIRLGSVCFLMVVYLILKFIYICFYEQNFIIGSLQRINKNKIKEIIKKIMIIKIITSTHLLKCLLILFLIMSSAHDTTFQEFKRQMEQVVIQIAAKMEEHYSNWCQLGIAKCQTLTVNACLGVTQKSCNTKFPKPVICFNEGQYISNTSNVNFPVDINYNNLTQQEIKFVCSSAKLQTTFQSLASNRNNKFTSMYFGNKRGLFRMFPGYFYGTQEMICDEYDPRYRPWYTIAASGAKNVIILLDKSRSMQDNDQFSKAKSAVKNVIQTLSISDNIGIIAFQNTTQFIGLDKLSRATNDYKEELKTLIQNVVSYQGETNFWNAFQTGLNMVNNAISSEESGCIEAQNVFLLVTDGNPTQDIIQAEILVERIKNYTNQNFRKSIEIFTYALGKSTNLDFLKTLSCAFKGIVISESDSGTVGDSDSAIISKLADFYAYLAIGVKFKNPVWTQPYTDFYGYGRMVTVSMPAYQKDPETNMSGLIGVAGVDIIMSRFDEYGLSEQDIVIQLIGQSACQKNDLQNCQVQALRSEKYRCNIQNCTVSNKTIKKCQKIPKIEDIYSKQSLNKDVNRCCGITLNQFIGSIIFGSFSFAVTILTIWKRKQIWKKFCKIQYRRIDPPSGTQSISFPSFMRKKPQPIMSDTNKNLVTLTRENLQPEERNQQFDPL